MSKIVVTVKHTIPLMDYGNIVLEATLEIDTTDRNELNVFEDTYHDVQHSLAMAILPMVNAEVERCMSVLVKEHTAGNSPDSWMRRNSKMYQWFKLAYPGVEIPAMGKFELVHRVIADIEDASR